MSNPVETAIEKIGTGIIAAEHFIVKAFSDVQKVDNAIKSLPPDTKSAFVKIFTDLTAAVAAATPAAEAEGLNFALDITAVNAIKTLINDAKNGVKDAEAFFNALGIKL